MATNRLNLTFDRLSNNNTCPSYAQRQEAEVFREIRLANVANIEDILSPYKAAVASLNVTINAITKQQIKEQQQADLCTKILAPIRRIPLEIIREFLLFSLPHTSGEFRPSLRCGPLQVSHVCSLWRRVALSTPELWTALYIIVRSSPLEPTVVHQYRKLARDWFSRAGRYMLTLRFDGSQDKGYNDFSDIIIPHLGRFNELDITLHHPDTLRTFLVESSNFHSSRFAGLYDLTLESVEWDNSFNSTTFSAAKHLRKLSTSIPFWIPDWAARDVFAPWEQLTFLDIATIDGRLWANLLSQCVNLKEARFYRIIRQDAFALPHYDITLSHLTSLTVNFDFGACVGLFDGFRFPALVDLQIDAPSYFSWEQPQHFYEQIRFLRRLRFSGEPEGLASLLPHTPSLLSLRIPNPDSPIDTLLIAMTVEKDSEDGVLVPKLEKLSISPRCYHPDNLLMMVKSRTANHVPPSVSSLRHLKIAFAIERGYENLPRDLGGRLRSLQCDGLPVIQVEVSEK